MKRYLINIFVFFSLTALVDVCVGVVGDFLQANAKGGDTKRTNDLVAIDKHDVLVFGSSRAHHHYDTPFMSEMLKLDVYNAGFDGCGVVLAYGFLELILERYQPMLVILDVEPSFDINVYDQDNNHVRYLGPLKPYYRHPAIASLINDVSFEEWYKVHSGLLRYNSSLIPKAIDYMTSRGDDVKGYKPEVGIYSGNYNRNPMQEKKVDEFKIKYVGRFITLLNEKNVPVVLVASPKLGESDSSVFEPIKELCINSGVPFIDKYSVREFQKKELFVEPMHLNIDGARLFSRAIISEIVNYIN